MRFHLLTLAAQGGQRLEPRIRAAAVEPRRPGPPALRAPARLRGGAARDRQRAPLPEVAAPGRARRRRSAGEHDQHFSQPLPSNRNMIIYAQSSVHLLAFAAALHAADDGFRFLNSAAPDRARQRRSAGELVQWFLRAPPFNQNMVNPCTAPCAPAGLRRGSLLAADGDHRFLSRTRLRTPTTSGR